MTAGPISSTTTLPAPRVALVVPCFNEASRLDTRAFETFAAENRDVRIVFVNDGSRDRTIDVLGEIRARAGDQIDVVDLPQNRGKAEAVRRGMLRALESGAELVGFWDADLATPLDASASFIDLLRERPALEMVIGSRVLLLGRTIERRAARHYLGRVFATAASMVLRLPVYDTQCGAKLFRASPRLAQVLQQPFLSTWVFDVELIARFGSLSSSYAPAQLREQIYELPLIEWREVRGSKVRPWHFGRALIDLVRIHGAYIGWRTH
jgi:dolichyl-phosphate beta-glucosyltransferase